MHNGAISWNSKRQPTVAKSSTEAEYMAANAAGAEAMWLKQLLIDFGYMTPPVTISMYSDSQPAIAASKNPEHHTRMKHINVMYHWLREQVEDHKIKLIYVPSEDQRADILTKNLEPKPFEHLRHSLGICPRPSH